MVVGSLELRILIRESRSLKDRRRVVKSLKDRIRGKFDVSVADVGDQDGWQGITLGAGHYFSDRLGVRLTAQRRSIPLGGKNTPYEYFYRYTLIYPPNYIPEEAVTFREVDWVPTEGSLALTSVGLEAASERVRNQVKGKKLHLEDFHNRVRWCQELEVIPNAFFIFSHPTETWEEAQETIRIIERDGEGIEASIAILHIYPGTPLEKTAKQEGVLPPDFSWVKKHPSKIITLPAAQGDVPLYKDRLTWTQISELIFRWSLSKEKASVIRKVPQVIANIRSWGDLPRYAVMAWVYAKLKVKRLFGKRWRLIIKNIGFKE